jgi:hypothetical protein
MSIQRKWTCGLVKIDQVFLEWRLHENGADVRIKLRQFWRTLTHACPESCPPFQEDCRTPTVRLDRFIGIDVGTVFNVLGNVWHQRIALGVDNDFGSDLAAPTIQHAHDHGFAESSSATGKFPPTPQSFRYKSTRLK